MGAATILDELKAVFDGLQVVAGTADVTFTWSEWEELEEARGAYVTAESDFDLRVSDIGGGAQSVEESVLLRFAWENQARTVDWAAWKNAFVAAVLAAIRGQEKGFTGAYFVEVTGISGERFQINSQGRGTGPYVNQMDFTLTARRHDVYG